MANEYYDKKISRSTNWGGDSSTGGLKVKGRRIQEFIKEELSLSYGYSRIKKGKFQFFRSQEDATAYDGGDKSRLLHEDDIAAAIQPHVEVTSQDVEIANNACTVWGGDTKHFIATGTNVGGATPRFRLWRGQNQVEEVDGVATYNGVSLNCTTGVLTVSNVDGDISVGLTAYTPSISSERINITVKKLVLMGGISVVGTKTYAEATSYILTLVPTNSDYTVPVASVAVSASINAVTLSHEGKSLQVTVAVPSIPSTTQTGTLSVTVTDVKGNAYTATEEISVQSIPVSDFTVSGQSEIDTAGTYAYVLTNMLPLNANKPITSLSVSAGTLPVVVNGTSGFSLTVASDPQSTEEKDITVTASIEGGTSVVKHFSLTLKKDTTAIDLGLPNGTLWRSKNIGADSPSDFGLYFSWGNTEGHAEGSGYDFSAETYAATDGAQISANLSLSYDAANVILGNGWRMPTRDDIQKLVENTDYELVENQGVKLMKKTDHNVYIFLPFTGRYEGTSLKGKNQYATYFSSARYDANYAKVMDVGTSQVKENDRARSFGCPIRPVK